MLDDPSFRYSGQLYGLPLCYDGLEEEMRGVRPSVSLARYEMGTLDFSEDLAAVFLDTNPRAITVHFTIVSSRLGFTTLRPYPRLSSSWNLTSFYSDFHSTAGGDTELTLWMGFGVVKRYVPWSVPVINLRVGASIRDSHKRTNGLNAPLLSLSAVIKFISKKIRAGAALPWNGFEVGKMSIPSAGKIINLGSFYNDCRLSLPPTATFISSNVTLRYGVDLLKGFRVVKRYVTCIRDSHKRTHVTFCRIFTAYTVARWSSPAVYSPDSGSCSPVLPVSRHAHSTLHVGAAIHRKSKKEWTATTTPPVKGYGWMSACVPVKLTKVLSYRPCLPNRRF
ncbi:hypothetical protein BDN72DRAFT_858104 [Pluteus cervinus]|uniref:Uncharacterized protein n=1 Tax=Pluteus cervinus TaxID=181527 RepID=A0ACD3ATL3_9AGAR|nr:hypothetical protein BDN72DRAFT_858104 [Pluteus cervinus]